MIYYLMFQKKYLKITIFIGFILLSAGGVLILLLPMYPKLQALTHQTQLLNQQWQQRHIAEIHRQQLKQDNIILEYPYQARLQSLHKPLATAELYSQISLLAKSHGLQIIKLKPQQHLAIAGLEQQILNIELSGAELKILNFLKLLCHQSWLLEIQQLELTPMAAGVHLQLTMAAYYA